MAYHLYPDYVKDVFAFQTEITLKNLELYKQALGDKILVVGISGADFGTQQGELISPDMFREFFAPFYSRMNEWVHKNTAWKTLFHTCGSVVNLLDEFVACGVDILNPVQCSAKGMRPEFLKSKYGGKLVFWGGGIDTQRTLPFGTQAEVRAEVFERLEIFSQNGGYVFNAIHNIQPDTPSANIIAMFDAVREFNAR